MSFGPQLKRDQKIIWTANHPSHKLDLNRCEFIRINQRLSTGFGLMTKVSIFTGSQPDVNFSLLPRGKPRVPGRLRIQQSFFSNSRLFQIVRKVTEF